MKVSIVIPTLNEEKVLRKALDSIKKQKTSHEVEIIIVDSYSKDGTLAIAKEYTNKIFSVPAGIIGCARDTGSKKSTGEIIVSAGADNIYDQHWLDELVAPIRSGEYVATAGKLLPADGNLLENLFSNFILSPISHLSVTLHLPLVAGESMAFSKKAFDKIGGYNTKLITHEDTDIFKRLQSVGRVAYCSKSITYVSTRRVKKWGYLKYLCFHTSNFFNIHLLGKCHDNYEVVR